MLRRTSIRIVLICVSFFSATFHVSAQSQFRNIFVLHSSEPSYEWTKAIQKSIYMTSSDASQPIKLSIEYMGSKRITGDRYESVFSEYLKEKYQGFSFDGIIVTNDEALRFLKKLDMPNLRNRPTVAGGISDLQASLKDVTPKSHIYYAEDFIVENILLIRTLKPEMKRLYYLTDNSVTSSLLREEVSHFLDQLSDIEIVDIENESLEVTEEILSKSSPNDAILLTHFNTEVENNTFYQYSDTAARLSAVSKAPVFVPWEFLIQGNVLGGYVSSSSKLGRDLVKQLGKMVENPFTIQTVEQEFVNAVFQYSALVKHDVSESDLPVGSKILNRPVSFLEKHSLPLLIVGLVLAAILLMSFLFFNYIRHRNTKLLHNQEFTSLELKMNKVLVRFISILGESIENRSGESGNHVRRVAKISARLARDCGMSMDDCTIIELASPMHDVGKVAIPDSVLCKNGNLSPDERVVVERHSELGYQLLNDPDAELMSVAANIALDHHEHWDGSGYPAGKSGKAINVFARIVAIADVFDALKSTKSYRSAWTDEEVKLYFIKQKGKKFEPRLVDVFLTNFDTLTSIRESYPD
ncbi:HD domain-containing phosphohydrolase [Vibrio sp. 10N.261.46.E12]|uniref:HD domain-containing phosphohydrolase n=2 Tax=Vibrio TaxID=662 RepID=UPI0013000AD6|nr:MULTISPECIES: HD domain-containing phosphohydrolase [unclassified Vibrio]